jgi:hypothetical protein
MQIIGTSAAILIVAFLAQAVPAAAEQLRRIDTIESYTNSISVFAGVARGSEARKVLFEIEKTWKGSASREIEVGFPSKRGVPTEPVIGDAYVVYMGAGEAARLLPYAPKSREVAVLDALSRTRYRVLAALDRGPVDRAGTLREAGPRPPPRSAEESQRKTEGFQKAHAFITEQRCEEALPYLEANIAEWPEAVDLDYEYAWAALCYARTGGLPKALSAYAMLTTRFFGFVPYKAGMNWEFQLRVIRDAVAGSNSEHAGATLQQMEDLHIAAIRAFRLDMLATVAAAERGDLVASARLAGPRFSPEFPKLIAAGVLGLKH